MGFVSRNPAQVQRLSGPMALAYITQDLSLKSMTNDKSKKCSSAGGKAKFMVLLPTQLLTPSPLNPGGHTHLPFSLSCSH